MNMYEQVYELMKSTPKMVLTHFIHQLMLEGKITFADIVGTHIKHLETLKEGAFERFLQLQDKATRIYFGKKKERDKNIGELMHWLLDEGRLNMTHEEIDKKLKLIEEMDIQKVESAEEMNFAEAQENGIIYELPNGAWLIPQQDDDYENETHD